MTRYLKDRSKEWSSRIGIFIPLVPTVVELTQWQSLALIFIGIVIVGVPEDKFKRN